MFTLIHVVVSVLGIIAGLVIVGGLLGSERLDGWTALFFATTIATSVTGFGFPFRGISPAIVVGTISLVVLAVCLMARYWKDLQGPWRAVYVLTAVTALYLNVFVLVVQLFVKVPALAQLAPTQREAPFLVTQVLLFALFLGLALQALGRFRPGKMFR